MAHKRPCLCQRSCTKLLSATQRYRHRKHLRLVLDHSDSDRSDSDAQAMLVAEPDMIVQDLPVYLPDDISDLQGDLANEHEHHWEDTMDGASEEETNSHCTSSNADMLSNRSLSPDDEFPGPEHLQDDLTPENLILVLEERFGDEWQQQLHEIRKSCEHVYHLAFEIPILLQVMKNSQMMILTISVLLRFALKAQVCPEPPSTVCDSSFDTSSTWIQNI